MSTTITRELTLENTDCCTCGIVYALPIHFIKMRRSDKQPFYCPSGHCQSFQRSEADKLRADVDELQRRLTASRCAESNALREKGAIEKELKRNKRRTTNGVCTCCNRTFQNLARHMKSKHAQPL